MPLTPSWYGDSVAHYEGDTLVIDTLGIKIGPYAMVDVYGTPHTPALHVVERYRLLDYEAAKAAEERGAKENLSAPAGDTGLARDPDYKGKGLRLEFTVEEDGVFMTPWTATVTYRRPPGPLGQWPEFVCADNANAYTRTTTERKPRCRPRISWISERGRASYFAARDFSFAITSA
jgi:hypothetical protein